jgi:protein TonB
MRVLPGTAHEPYTAMNASLRNIVFPMLVLAGLCGCRTMGEFTVNSPTTIFRMVSSLFHHDPKDEPSPAAASLVPMNSATAHKAPSLDANKAAVAQPAVLSNAPTLDAYKTDVARHVVESNRDQTFSGKLPEMLPAIVVLRITVDREGNLANVEVQRYRDAQAAWVAVTSVRLSDPFPKPVKLLATNAGQLTFSETFLFDDEYRFQLRSLAGPQ